MEAPSTPTHENAATAGPTEALPSVALTIFITFLFGLFGLIPASMHAARAGSEGHSGARYWKAFGWTLGAGLVVWGAFVVTVLVLVAAGPSVASGTVLLQGSGTSDSSGSTGLTSESFVPEGDLLISYTVDCTNDGRAADVGLEVGLSGGTDALNDQLDSYSSHRFNLLTDGETGAFILKESDLGDLKGEPAFAGVELTTIGATCGWEITVAAA